ncbi:MAG TPA: prolipoprotein diacylglyceryl transferase [Verrucomicrobia bacterium]|nr:prolipoprotein diacylglyceryl transferase [Verrucomicrobiota bacterium]
MHPDLVDIGFLHLKTYGFCMALGFLLCWKLAEKLSGRKDLSNLLLLLMFAGVAGSRLAYAIENWRTVFAAHPLAVFRVWEGGLVFYGGLILAILAFFVWCRVKREKAFDLANLFAVVIPLGHAFGRVGCFFYGCCFGRRSTSSLAVVFPAHSPAWYTQVQEGVLPPDAVCSLPVLPTQLFESAALLVLFAVLLLVYRRARQMTAGAYLVLYGLVRFGLEFLRDDPRAHVGPLSIGQTISIGMIILGIAFLRYGYSLHNHR